MLAMNIEYNVLPFRSWLPSLLVRCFRFTGLFTLAGRTVTGLTQGGTVNCVTHWSWKTGALWTEFKLWILKRISRTRMSHDPTDKSQTAGYFVENLLRNGKTQLNIYTNRLYSSLFAKPGNKKLFYNLIALILIHNKLLLYLKAFVSKASCVINIFHFIQQSKDVPLITETHQQL